MSGIHSYPDVFKPLKVGNLILKNRIQFPPMVCCLSNATGEVTQEYVNFIEMQAKTGAALVTIGATPVDNATGQDFRGELNVEEFAKEIVNFTRNMLMMLLRQHDVTLIGGEKVVAITPDGAETMDRDLVSRFHRADAVVTAFGLTPNNEGMDGFFDIVPETYAIGDCWYGAKTIGNANTSAFNFAMEI